MKSIHIIGSRLSGGAERFYMRLVRALQEHGQAVCAINRAHSAVAHELGTSVPQRHAPMANRWDLWSRWKISRAIQEEQPHIVQTYMTRATVLTHLPRHHQPVHIARLGGYYKIARYLHAHAWIGNTKGICDYLIKGGLPAARVFYIGNFVDVPLPVAQPTLQALREQWQLADDALIVMSAGRVNHVKGFDILLAAFARLPARIRGRPVHMLLLGDGPLRASLEQQWQSSEAGTRIHWTGWQSEPALYYQLADVFVSPSRHEPLGNVILEAWSYAKPVVATATVGAVELMTEGVNGLLVPLEDPAALSQSLRRLLEDAALSQELGQAGYTKVKTEFAKDAVVAAYDGLYRQLAGL